MELIFPLSPDACEGSAQQSRPPALEERRICAMLEAMERRTLQRLLLMLVAEVAIVSFLGQELVALPQGRATVTLLDVGQGDSILLTTPSGRRVLIDGGPSAKVIEELPGQMPFFDRSIDLAILTHPDLDHVGGLPDVLRRYHVGAVLMTGLRGKEVAYTAMQELIREYKIPVYIADPTQDIDMGDGVVLDIVWPPPIYAGKEVDKANDTSVVVRALFGTGSILLTGDIEAIAEHAILASGANLRASILKVPHHGSKTSTSTGFLLATNPSLAVISVAKKNGYGHPHPSIVERLGRAGVAIRSTAQEGTFSIEL